jgi:hypothetical protein
MSSSTFSFRAELKVIALVVAAMAAAEAAFPLVETRLSSDLRQINELSQKLQQGCSTPDLSVVVLGNSLTLHGFDQPMIQAASASRFAVPTKFTFVVFQGAFMTEMYRIYMHYVARTSPPPKLILMPFAADGLTDQSGVEIARMVYHCDWTDVHDVIKNEVGLGQLGEFLHCYFSKAFANRLRVRQFVFQRLLPEYHESEVRIRSANRPPAAAHSANGLVTYTRLDHMLDLCSRKGTRVVLLAMPTRTSYEIRPEVVAIMAKYKMDLMDMRDTPGLDGSRYMDASHLNKKGAEVFSDAFLNRFAQYQKEAE